MLLSHLHAQEVPDDIILQKTEPAFVANAISCLPLSYVTVTVFLQCFKVDD